ncbi:MAG: type II secretion system protein [Rhodocyclaceae bacterium]|jgi:MSHA biogenesis protein MshO|nr:type II secretion system protein [Rhodocyclaceae bacterium]
MGAMRTIRTAGQGGFTLIEAIMVIVITGVIAGMVAVFIRAPVEGYVDTRRRAALSDAADTALRRILRDVRLALPNSVRVSGDVLEFIPLRSGGMYRHDDACFAAPGCSSLVSIGSLVAPGASGQAVAVTLGSDQLAIYNQYNNSGNDCSPASGIYSIYCGHGVATLAAPAPATAAGEDTFSFATTTFLPPGGSPSGRFYVIPASPVTYACDATARQLKRYGGYARQAAQPTNIAAAPLSTAASITVLADNVDCTAFDLDYVAGVSARFGLLTLALSLTDSGETVTLMGEAHVDNAP